MISEIAITVKSTDTDAFLWEKLRFRILILHAEIQGTYISVEIIIPLLGDNAKAAFFMGFQGCEILFAYAIAQAEGAFCLHGLQNAGKQLSAIALLPMLRMRFQRLQKIQSGLDPAGSQCADP